MERETGCSLGRAGRIEGLRGMPCVQEGARERQEQQAHRRLAAFASRREPMEWLTAEIELPRTLKWL
eukprot:3529897-Lingulodinium_polyedra.AAC.1